MPITYPLSLPNTVDYRDARMTARTVVGVTRSPFTGAQQVQKHQGQWWEFEGSLITMGRDKAEPWLAFILSLNGREGTFLLGDPHGVAPQGSAGGSPVVKGANQTGGTLVTDGWTASQTGILKAGDYIQLGSSSSARLHKLLSDADSNSSGEATLEIYPEIKTAHTDNSSVITANACGVFKLATNEMPFSLMQARTYGISFAAVGVV
jgi:hypothetical protein